MANKKVENYTGTRVTFHSTQPFDVIMQKLYASIGGPEKIPAWLGIARSISGYSAEDREKFIQGAEKQIGPHGFMIFQVPPLPFRPMIPAQIRKWIPFNGKQEFNHGAWVPLFDVGDGMKSKRIILGNPLIAITMLKHDMMTGLSVPVELLVLEKKEGGVDLVYQLPSALIAGLNRDENLVSAVDALDRKLEKLVQDISS
jgi:hypothetical protein